MYYFSTASGIGFLVFFVVQLLDAAFGLTLTFLDFEKLLMVGACGYILTIPFLLRRYYGFN